MISILKDMPQDIEVFGFWEGITVWISEVKLIEEDNKKEIWINVDNGGSII